MGFTSGTYTRSNGVHSGTTMWQDSAAAGNNIETTLFDAAEQDIADALSQCLLKDGTQTVTANLPMNSKKLTGLADGSGTADSASLGQIQKQTFIWGGTSGGSGSSYTISLSPALSAYTAGVVIRFKAHTSGLASATLSVNALGGVAIKKWGGVTDLEAGDIGINEIVTVIHNGTNWVLVSDQGLGSTANVKHAKISANTAFTGTYLTASSPLQTNSTKDLVTVSASTFKTNHSIAASGANTDITSVNGIVASAYSPTITAAGSMSVSSVVINDGKYVRIGPFVYFAISATFTLGGVASNQIYLSQPISGSGFNAATTFVCAGEDGGGSGLSDLRWRHDQVNSRITVFKAGTPNFTLGGNAAIHINGFYFA